MNTIASRHLRPVTALWALGILLVAAFITLRLSFAGSLTHQVWDAAWYLHVAQYGYVFDGDYSRQHNVAFFPGYPMLAGLAAHVIPNLHVAGLVAAIGATAAGMVLWYKTLAAVYVPPVPAMATALTMAFPFSLFLLAGYGECLLFLGMTGFLYEWMVRKRPLAAGAYIAVATLAKVAGILLLAVPLVELALAARAGNPPWSETLARVRERRVAWLLMPLLPLAALAGMQIHFWWRFGDPLVYLRLGATWGHKAGAASLSEILALEGFFSVASGLAKDPLNNPAVWGTAAAFVLPVMTLLWRDAMPRTFLVLTGLFSLLLFVTALPLPMFYQAAGRYALLFLPGFAAVAVALCANGARRAACAPAALLDPGHARTRASWVPAFVLLLAIEAILFLRFTGRFYRFEWVA